METIILILIILSIFHFIYESAVLPTIRLNYRYKLFQLRDQLRNLKFQDGISVISDKEFNIVEHNLFTSINVLPKLSLSEFITAKMEIEKDEHLRRKLDEKIDIIKSSENKEIKEIYDKSNLYTFIVFMANLGGWFPYVLPLIIISITYNEIKKSLSEISVASSHTLGTIVTSNESFAHA